MYGTIEVEDILADLLDRVPDDIDKREGSIIYNALAPCATELQKMYKELQVLMDETFADTASMQYLMKRAAERGIQLKEATHATIRGVFTPETVDVLDKRFSEKDLIYAVDEKIADGQYMLRCETPGEPGNLHTGQLIPIDYVEGLETANIAELLIPGEDEETTEQLRKRYFDSLNTTGFGGNIAGYKQWVNDINGVGGVKVYPVWNGGGTVKLVIISSNYGEPSQELISSVQTAVDPVQNHGEGMGIAPIGHVVTVTGVFAAVINVATSFTYADGWTWDDVKPYAEQTVDTYFRELAEAWADSENLIVRISQLESRFLTMPGIVDVSNTRLNGAAQNAELGADSIPERGNISG